MERQSELFERVHVEQFAKYVPNFVPKSKQTLSILRLSEIKTEWGARPSQHTEVIEALQSLVQGLAWHSIAQLDQK